MVLNARFGFNSSAVIEYAILMAAFSVAFDITKVSCLIMASRACRNRAFHRAALLFLLFLCSFTYSLYAGLSEIARDRDAATADLTADGQTRRRTEAAYNRLSAELAAMQRSPVYASTANCTVLKTAAEKRQCQEIARAKQALATADKTLTAIPPRDPQPQVTLFVALSGWSLPTIQFSLAIWPVLLAEICGSLAFYLTDIKRTQPEPSRKTVDPSWWHRLLRYRPKWKTPPTPQPGTAATLATRASASAPSIQWSPIPRATKA
jgi:hypothetical protein